MVMTQSTRPGISLAGIGLACTLALVGWITTPAWSSPPKDTCDVACKTVVVKGDAASDCCPKSGKKCEAQCRMLVLGGDVAGEGEKKRGERKVIVKRLGEEGGHDDALGLFYALAAGDDEDQTHHFLRQLSRPDDDDLEQRLARLEQAVQQLNKLLGGESLDIHLPAPPAPPARPAPPKPLTWHTPQGQTFKIGDGAIGIALGAPWASADEGEAVARAYKLPEGKLKALTALMVRQDVPVLVSPKEDCIEVHGTPAQHKIFGAFVELIHPSGKGSAKVIETGPHSCSVTISPSSFDAACKSYADAAFLLGADQKEHLESLDSHKGLLPKLHALGVNLPKLHALGVNLPKLHALGGDESKLLKLQVVAEASDLLEEAEELHEHAEAFEHAKPRQETEELLRAVRELQQQAKQLAELARELEQKSKQADK